MGDRDKDAEILALRHQIALLESQPGVARVRFTAPDRAFLAARNVVTDLEDARSQARG